MRDDQISEAAALLFKYEELLAFIDNLTEVVESEFDRLLAASMERVVRSVEAADPRSRNDFEPGNTSVLFWPSAEHEDSDEEKSTRLAFGLYLTSTPLSEESSAWITCRGHKKTLKRLRKAHDEKESWILWMTQGQKNRKSAQFEWDFDWHREYQSFNELETQLCKRIVELMIGLREADGE